MIFHKIDQNSEEWDAVRLGKFTASTFNDLFMKPDLLGFKKAISKVVYERITGESYGHFSTKRMEAGHELENLAREHYENQTFETVLPGGFFELNEWVGCSPDGRIGENTDGIVEFKSRDPHIYFEYIETGKLPNVNMWQVYGQLYVTGSKWCDYMPYCHPNLKTLIIRIFPDEEKFKQLEVKLNECIEIVKERIVKFKNYE
jgi:hypothetical protein